MSTSHNRFLQFVRLSHDTVHRRLRRKRQTVEPRLDLMPKLDAAKEAEISRMLTELNQQVLREIEPPDQGRAERSKQKHP